MKKRTLALMLSAALCVGLLAGCGSGNNDPVNTPAAGGSETPSQESTAALSGTVNTNGSTSMESVMGYLTEGFKEVQPGITVNYTGSGSSAGVTGAQDGTCDIGLASRPMKTTWPSVPPTSAQLVISPVASWAICSTLRSATGLLGLTMMAMPSLATVMALTPVSSSFRSREARPMSQVP